MNRSNFCNAELVRFQYLLSGEIAKNPWHLNESLVVSDLRNPAPVYYDDVIRIDNGRESMRDNDAGGAQLIRLCVTNSWLRLSSALVASFQDGLDYPIENKTAGGGVYIIVTGLCALMPLLLLLLTFALCHVVWRGLIDEHKAVNLLKYPRSQDRHRHPFPGFGPPVIPGTAGLGQVHLRYTR